MLTNFNLQPSETDLQNLAEQYWQSADEKEHQLEASAYEAGSAIRQGEFTLANLEIIVRWKAERVVPYLIGNSDESIRAALSTVAAPETVTETAVQALTSLRGVDIAIASAILAAIYPERYAVLDCRALEALGHARHDITFYAEYNRFIQKLVEHGVTHPQSNLPGPTPLHAMERALWQWARNQGN
ncbi:hypothetical protein ACOBR2_00705 [Telmatobacter bradus]|uniref:hypothetical protein n=1 Tax=Telmatobacter bradus TaxID=474953 RepID=UPI003B4372A7